MAEYQLQIKNLKQLRALASGLVKQAKPGWIIGLVGELGSGKTTFVKYIAKEFSIREQIISPTFIYHQTYSISRHPSIKNLQHYDLYRVKGDAQLRSLGLEPGDDDDLALIEWSNHSNLITKKAILIFNFQYINPNTRLITVSAKKNNDKTLYLPI